MKATAFYEVVEKGTGWLHNLELRDNLLRMVIEDDTDDVTVYANYQPTPQEIAAIWTNLKVGSSSFRSEAESTKLLDLGQPADVSDDAMKVVWSGTGETLSELAD